MKKRKAITPLVVVLSALVVWIAGIVIVPAGLLASSHREAPITSLDHTADITDLWAFRSYDSAGHDTSPPSITMIMGVDPLLEPANGPNWFPFDPNVLYEINVDNNEDGYAEVQFQFRFSSHYQLPTVYTGLAGFDDGTSVVPPQIQDFSNPGLNLRQSYTVTMLKNGAITPITGTSPLYAVPANAGPRTINYAALYKAGTYTNVGSSGVSVFAGTADDPFFIDLGAAFDTGNFRAGSSGVPGVLTASEDAANANFAPDTVSGYAVNVIAIQVPITMLTSTGNIELPTSTNATIGIWGSTLRPRITLRRSPSPELSSPHIASSRNAELGFRQVQRMGNPLINELIIGIGSKDRWSMDKPYYDAQFASYDLDPPFVHIVDSLYSVLVPGALYSPPAPRTDLLPLVQYLPPIAAPNTPKGPIADLLRLNTGVPPGPPASANRLGAIAGDFHGFPNGRRLADDVVDIALRIVVGGVAAGNLCGPANNSNCNVFPNNALGDGVNVNDVNSDYATDGETNLVEPNTHFHTSFPYVDYCPSGRDRVHINPGGGGVGCTGGTGPACVNGAKPISLNFRPHPER
jgi:hypothetical protein